MPRRSSLVEQPAPLTGKFRYLGYHGAMSLCHIKVERRGRSALVVATELPDNPGTSITNAAEALATGVCRFYNLSPHGLEWIEHYLANGPAGETWSLVSFGFDWQRGEFNAVSWAYLDPAAVERMGLRR